MNPRGKFKVAFYFILFAVSMYSASRIIEPVLALTSGETGDFGEGLISRLVPMLAQGGDEETMDEARAYIDALIDDSSRRSILEEAKKASSDDALGGLQDALARQDGSPSTSTTSSSGARILRKPGRGSNRIDPNSIRVRSLAGEGLDGSLEQALQESAVALHHRGEIDKAIRAYERELEQRPDHAGLRLNLAIARFQTGDYENAWREVRALRRRGGAVPDGFLKALAAKMPDPESDA